MITKLHGTSHIVDERRTKLEQWVVITVISTYIANIILLMDQDQELESKWLRLLQNVFKN